jgi:putative nucleotidyltransferase with HDIG domain
MTTLSLADVIKNIRDLPSLPVVVMEVLNSFEQTDVNIGELAHKVAQDQALAAKTMRLSNSSFYGLSRKVTTIQQAITILGFDSVRTLITAAAVTDNFAGSKHATFDFKAFWRHAIGTALCSKMLARQMKLNQDYAFVSGLLHDIGKLVLVTRYPQEYGEAIAYREAHDCYMIEAERKVLGLDHAVVGRALAEYWKFPLTMQKAIANHHDPDEKDAGDIPAVVHVAEAIAHALDLSHQKDDLVPVLNDRAWRSVNMTPAIFRQVCRDTESEFEEACQILVAG